MFNIDFIPDEIIEGKLVFTKEHFSKILDKVYREGYNKGYKKGTEFSSNLKKYGEYPKCPDSDPPGTITNPTITWWTNFDDSAYEKIPYWQRPNYTPPKVTSDIHFTGCDPIYFNNDITTSYFTPVRDVMVGKATESHKSGYDYGAPKPSKDIEDTTYCQGEVYNG